MNPSFQRRIQRYGWDRAASDYEAGWRRQLRPARDRLLEVAALRPRERVLETACGTGLVTLPIAAAVGPEGAVTATDLSAGMLEVAREAARARGLANVAFARMDAEALDFADGRFDVALCALGLMYVSDPARALCEMRRVLVPGGRVAVAVWGERRNCGWAEIFPIVDRRVQSDVCPLFFQLGGRDVLAGSLRDAGFAHVTSERLPAVLHYDTGTEACAAAFAGGPVALAYRKFDAPTRDEVHAEYLASLAPYRCASGYDIPGEFVVASGIRRGD